MFSSTALGSPARLPVPEPWVEGPSAYPAEKQVPCVTLAARPLGRIYSRGMGLSLFSTQWSLAVLTNHRAGPSHMSNSGSWHFPLVLLTWLSKCKPAPLPMPWRDAIVRQCLSVRKLIRSIRTLYQDTKAHFLLSGASLSNCSKLWP